MEKKLRVVQIMPEFALAGAEIMVENLTNALQEYADVYIVSLYSYHSVITDRLEKTGVKIFFLNKKRGLDLKIIYRLVKLFKKVKPDVVHTHRYSLQYALPAAIISGVPIKVHTIHNMAQKEIGRVPRIFAGFFYKYCEVIPVAISPKIKETILEEYGLVPEKVPMIFNGVELSNCIPKKSYDINSGSINILHIGRFSEQKNHRGLIDSFKLLHAKSPNAKLTLIGIGELESEIKEMVKNYGLNDYVNFLGLKSNVYQFLNQADIFILPSLWEGMPITIIEAMATGLPIVSTNVGGVTDMIKDGKSALVVDVNSERIADALFQLIENRELREHLGRCAKKAAEQFTSKKMTERYLLLYKQNKSGI